MKNLENLIRDVPDFPKPGIIFKDITPILQDAGALKLTLEKLSEGLSGKKIDKVVGIEARGFLFGTMLAEKLGAGFVPIRKAGKLPAATFKEPYTLEYGIDALEMHEDAISKGERVLVHDDVLATGGTAEATCKLVEKAGGEIVQCNFLIELGFLNGREKLGGRKVKSLFCY